MARAVEFRELTPRDFRDRLIRKVEEAPAEHAEAVLASYDLLQRLYDRGVIDFLNGFLSAGDMVVERITDVISSKDAITALRLSLILGNLVTSLDPEKVRVVLSASGEDEPPSLISILKQASSKDARRGIATTVGLLNALGAALDRQHSKG